jgi:hypothetical protein
MGPKKAAVKATGTRKSADDSEIGRSKTVKNPNYGSEAKVINIKSLSEAKQKWATLRAEELRLFISFNANKKLANYTKFENPENPENETDAKPDVSEDLEDPEPQEEMIDIEKVYYHICKQNPSDHPGEMLKKKIIEKIIEKEKEYIKKIIDNARQLCHAFCHALSEEYFKEGILVIFKDSQDLAYPNKIAISVISNKSADIKKHETQIVERFGSIIKTRVEIIQDENDLSESFSVQLIPEKDSEIYDTQEECDSQKLNDEYDKKMQEIVKYQSTIQPEFDPNKEYLKQKLMEQEFLKGQSSYYLNSHEEMTMKELNDGEIDSLKKSGLVDGENIVLIAKLKTPHAVRLDKVSNSHSQFSEGKPFKISYNLKSKCQPFLFRSCAEKILKTPENFKMFSTVFAWCGKATLKSCDESVNAMRTLFTEYSITKTQDFLECCKLLLELEIEGSQIFLKTMYKEFPSQMIYKIYVSQKKRPITLFYGDTEMNVGTFLSVPVNCGKIKDKSTIRDVSLKITNDTFSISGGGKKMKGGAIDFDIEYLFSIYLNGVVSLFTTHMPGGVPINDLLSQFIINLNIYGRSNNYLWVSSQVGGGAQSCYRIGKKADFDARVYLINSTYEQLLLHIIGVETGFRGNIYLNGTLSKLNNYIHQLGNSYFNPEGYRFVFDEYTFCVFFDRTQIRQHKPEGGKFPVRLISIDIVWKVYIYETAKLRENVPPIGYYYHYSGIFDLVVKTNENIYDKIKQISQGEITDDNFEDFKFFSTVVSTFPNVLTYFTKLIIDKEELRHLFFPYMEEHFYAFFSSGSALRDFTLYVAGNADAIDYFIRAISLYPQVLIIHPDALNNFIENVMQDQVVYDKFKASFISEPRVFLNDDDVLSLIAQEIILKSQQSDVNAIQFIEYINGVSGTLVRQMPEISSYTIEEKIIWFIKNYIEKPDYILHSQYILSIFIIVVDNDFESVLESFMKILASHEKLREQFGEVIDLFRIVLTVDLNKTLKLFIQSVSLHQNMTKLFPDANQYFQNFIISNESNAIAYFFEAITHNDDLLKMHSQMMQNIIRAIHDDNKLIAQFSNLVSGYYFNFKFKDCIFSPYGENECCPIYTMSCLVKTILETLGDLLNVLNRINTLKFVKDFDRLIDICDKAISFCLIDEAEKRETISSIKSHFNMSKNTVFATTNTVEQFDAYTQIQAIVVSEIHKLIYILKFKPSISDSVSIDRSWVSSIKENIIVNKSANKALSEVDGDSSRVIVIKKDLAISVFTSWIFYDNINQISVTRPLNNLTIEKQSLESYPDYSGLLKKMLQVTHNVSRASSRASSRESSQNLDSLADMPTSFSISHAVAPGAITPINKNRNTASASGRGRGHDGGNRKTKKKIIKATKKKRISKSNRKTKRK